MKTGFVLAVLAISAAFTLAACSGESASEPGDAKSALRSERIIDTGKGGSIPERFIGVWDYGAGGCDRPSDLRLEIGYEQFVFYESVGTVEDVQLADADSNADAMVALVMEGEGDTWDARYRLAIDEAGLLHVTETDAARDMSDAPRRRGTLYVRRAAPMLRGVIRRAGSSLEWA